MPIPAVEGWNGPGSKDADLTKVVAQDNALHPHDSKWAFEHWYYDARLDSGHTVIAFLQKRRPEERPGSSPVVELLVYSPDGTRQQVTKHYPKAAFRASTETCEVAIGASHASSDFTGDLPVHHLHAAEDDLVFDLTFTNETPSWMGGKGTTQYGATDFFGWVVPAPRARVTGSVTIDGEKREVTGRGYHDHNWGVGNMPRIIERWHWGRLYTDDFSLLFASVRTQARYAHHESRPLMLAHGREIVLSTGEMELTEGPMVHHPDAGRSYPEWIRLQVHDTVDLTLKVRSVVHAHDLLDDVPVVRSRLVKPLAHRLLGHPGYFRFNSDFELTVVVDGQKYERDGSTLHELVALR
jgi:CrtC N-terminal lipocalin domain